MNQANPFFQGGTTVLDPVALAFTVALGLAMFMVQRRWVLVPLLLTMCFVPMQQRVVIASLDFDMGRIMILFGWARLLARGELDQFRSTVLDRWFVVWIAVGTLFFFLGAPSATSLIYRAGIALDALGMYFLCRAMVRTSSDVENAVEILCWIALAIAPFMVFESITRLNPFSIVGGVDPHALVRDGRVRATGSFAHPIMAGTFGATLFPLAIALWRARPERRLAAVAGLLGSVALTVLPASSGAVLALITAVIGWGLWSLRRWMRLIRWSAVVLLVVLHVVREAPVWHLIGRASDLIGGTGWHRYALIDAFIAYWREWMLVGLGTRSTRAWGWGLEDVTNQFVAEGVQGGIVTLATFVALVSASFVSVSRIMTRGTKARALSTGRRHQVLTFTWGLGVAMAAHCTSWISVSYFGQMWAFLYLHLALIAALRTDPGLWGRNAHALRATSREGERRPEGGGLSDGTAAPSLGRRLFKSDLARPGSTQRK